MSISLPNGTILAAPSSSTSQVSAAVTRILHLSNFSAELKTRDLQVMFKDWENEKGGFRIKWVDDVNALVVFQDALVAKRAYLSVLLQPPPAFPPPAHIKPYDRPDAAQIIQSLAVRSLGHRSSMSSAMTSGQFSLPTLSHPHTTQPDLSTPFHSRTMSLSTTQPSQSSFITSSIPNSVKIPISRNSISNTRQGHGRNGSTSSGTNWGRQSLSGVLNFNSQALSIGGGGSGVGSGGGSGGVRRLPAHSESESSADDADPDPMVLMDTNVPLKVGERGSFSGGVRRESVSADKAMREVQKALASVEARG